MKPKDQKKILTKIKMTTETKNGESAPNLVPIFPIPRGRPDDPESWRKVLDQSAASDKQLLEGCRSNFAILASRQEVIGGALYHLPSNGIIMTYYIDRDQRSSVDIQKLESFIDSVSMTYGGTPIGYTVRTANRSQFINGTHLSEGDGTVRRICGFKIL